MAGKTCRPSRQAALLLFFDAFKERNVFEIPRQ